MTRHLRLLARELAKNWLATLLIAIVVGVNVVLMAHRGDFSEAEIVVAAIGILAAGLFLQATFLFMSYRLFSGSAFEGSFFVIAVLVTIFLIIAIVAASFLARSRVEGFPTEELPLLILGLYAVVVVFLFGAFRMSHWFFGLIGRNGSTAR